MGNESYVSSVFLAEAHEGTRVGEGFDVLKEKFNSLKLAEPAGGDKDIISEKTGDFFDTFSRGYQSVEHMENIVGDNRKTERQKQFAMNDLDLLGKVVYDAVRDDDKYKRLIGQGSASEIDENLPKEFKGIGKVVLTNVFEEGRVLETLRKLDESKAELGRTPDGNEKSHDIKMLVNRTIRRLRSMENLTPGQSHDKAMSLAYLTREYPDKEISPGSLGTKLEDVKTEKVKSEKKQEIRRQEAEKNEKKSEDGEDRMEIPLDKEGQLAMVRKLLEKVENSQRTTRDIYQGQFSARLEEIIVMQEIHPEVATEVRSRLKLHDCSVLMKKSNGYIEQPRSGGDPECPTVGMAATLAEGLNHALDNESVNFFLKSDANGFPVAEAWDYYQDVNIKYGEILKKIEKTPGELTNGLKTVIDNDPDLGSIDADYFTDGNFNRKKRVDEYVVEELMGKKKVNRAIAEKAWNMAKKLATATGENSIFNAALSGNDEMAEDIYLKIYRQGRDLKGRPRGPQIHVNEIVGIGNSFLRQLSNVDPADSSGIIPLYTKNIVTEPKDLGGGKKEGIEEGAYVYHFGVLWSGKIHPLRGLLLKRDPDPRETIGIDSLQTAQDYFKKADLGGKKNLKYWWVMGVLDLACSYGSLGWTQNDISKFRQYLTRTNLSQEAGPFLSVSEWDRAMKEGGFINKMFKLDIKRLGQSFFDSSSGGRRK